MDDSPRHRGDPLDIHVSLLEGDRPVPGARVHATVEPVPGPNAPAGAGSELTLLDDGQPPDETAGDGLYAGRVARLDWSGFSRLFVAASRRGVPGLADFDRQAGNLFLVSAGRSRLNGKVRDFTRDKDGDGLNDEIVFAVGVSVTDDDKLMLGADVRDAKGRRVSTFTLPADVSPGERELELVCDTGQFAGEATPGVLSLDTLWLSEPEVPSMLDRSAPGYRTRAYGLLQVMHEPIRLVGTGRAHGVDLDGDGRFDALDAEIPIDIQYPGPYACSGVLVHAGEWLGQGGVNMNFVQGRNVMHVRFPGSCVASADTRAEFVFDHVYVGYLKAPGDRRPSPQYGYSGGPVPLTGAPPPSRFEPTPPGPGPPGTVFDCR